MKKRTKFFVLRASIVLVFALLAARLWYLQVVMATYYTAQADTSKIRNEPVQAFRGIIYDRTGQQLVVNSPSWNAEIVPHGVPQAQRAAVYGLLSRLMGNKPTPQAIAAAVTANAWRPYTPFVVKAGIQSQTAMEIKQLHTLLPGVRADPAAARTYHDDGTVSLSHIVGYAGRIGHDQYASSRLAFPIEHYGQNDLAGQVGIESLLDPYLHGVNGTDQVEVDAGERPVRLLRHGVTVPGDSIYLTIDAKLQQQVAADLQAGLNKLNVRQGVAIVEDVHSGQILSMVSLPGYNTNWFSSGTGVSQRQYNALLNDPAQPLNDQAAGGVFPPGSTYKIITAAAALQSNVADFTRFIDDTGLIKLCSTYDASVCQYYYGWNPQGLGSVNIVTALAKSSDIYFYTVAGGNPNVDKHMRRIGADRLAGWAHLFGLGTQIGANIPGEQVGLIPSLTWYDHLPAGSPYKQPDHPLWSIGDTYNMAIGQGQNLATPLQIVNMAATIANGGILYRPNLVYHIDGRVVPHRGVNSRAGTIEPFVPSIVRRNFIDPQNLALIQQGMHESVMLPGYEGTSYEVRDARINAAGKTGTAEAPGGPDAWWVGYAPFNNPKIAVVVLVPHDFSEGATAAAPIAHKIFEDYFHLPANPNWVQTDVSRFLVPGTSTGRAG